MSSIFGGMFSGSANPIFGGLGAAVAIPGGGSSAAGSTQSVTFIKADGSGAATFDCSVKLSGLFTRVLEGGASEASPKAKQSYKFLLDSDPDDTLGVPLATDDIATWNGKTLLVVGTAVHDGQQFIVVAELIA